MYTERHSRSPSFPRNTSPGLTSRLRTDKKQRPSLSPKQPLPKSEKKSPPKLINMFRQICCPNCRYLFKIIKEEYNLTTQPTQRITKPQPKPTVQVSTQTSSMKDISHIAKQIDALLMPMSFEQQLPKFDVESRVTKRLDSPSRLSENPLEKYHRKTAGSRDKNFNTVNFKETYLRFYEKETLLQELLTWLKRQPIGIQIPAYIKSLIEP